MAHGYTKIKTILLNELAGKDMRAILVMSNTTADTDKDVATLGAITTLDEYDGSGYAREVLTGEAVAEDLVNDRAEWTSDVWNFGDEVGAGTRNAIGIVIVEHHATPGLEVPWFYVDGGFPGGGIAGAGGPFTYTPHADGVVHLL